jgi:hypothetical protein
MLEAAAWQVRGADEQRAWPPAEKIRLTEPRQSHALPVQARTCRLRANIHAADIELSHVLAHDRHKLDGRHRVWRSLLARLPGA